MKKCPSTHPQSRPLRSKRVWILLWIPFFPISASFSAYCIHFGRTTALRRIPPATDRAQAHLAVGGKAKQHLSAEFGMRRELGLGQTANGFDPAKGLFDALAHAQAALVAGVPSGTAINGRVRSLGRHVWSRDLSPSDFLYSRASASLLLAWLSLLRRSPWKLTQIGRAHV